MRTIVLGQGLCALGLALIVGGCASEYKKEAMEEQQAKTMPVNCATAEGDLRVLQSAPARRPRPIEQWRNERVEFRAGHRNVLAVDYLRVDFRCFGQRMLHGAGDVEHVPHDRG